jgi:hypothetical protein
MHRRIVKFVAVLSPSRVALLAAVALLALSPAVSHADRGAISLDGGGLVSGLKTPPPVGTGDSVLGTTAGAVIGARYALQNSLEIYAQGSWYSPVSYFHDNTQVMSLGTPVTGKLQSKVGRIGAVAGADYVMGYVWRLHLGGQFGWSNVTYDNVQHSSGLTFGTKSVDYLVVAPRAGLEWAVTDHFSVTVAPTLELLLGSASVTAFTLPVFVSYSWYR